MASPTDEYSDKTRDLTPAQIAQLDRMLLERHGAALMSLIMRTVQYGLKSGEPPRIALDTFAKELRERRATFVTLERNGRLRGCIGSIVPTRPLVEDVVQNAFAAAFRDPRFPKLTAAEQSGLGMSLSLLSPMSPMTLTSNDDLLDQLAPGQDGLLIQDGSHRAVFLPQVWDQLAEPDDFLGRLKLKADLPEDHWSDTFQAWRFSVQKVPPLGIGSATERQRRANQDIGTPVLEGDEVALTPTGPE